MHFSFPKVVFFDIGDTLVQEPIGGGRGLWVHGAKEIVKELCSRNIRLGLISNTGSLTRTELLAILPADFTLSIFNSNLIFLSSEVAVEKPKPSIFLKAIQESGTIPKNCLFCGDSFVETFVAHEVGMLVAKVSKPPNSDITEVIHALDNLLLI